MENTLIMIRKQERKIDGEWYMATAVVVKQEDKRET